MIKPAVLTLSILGAAALGGYYLFDDSPSAEQEVLATAVDPLTLAENCETFAKKNPRKELPSICTEGLAYDYSETLGESITNTTYTKQSTTSGTPIPVPTPTPAPSPTPVPSPTPIPGPPFANAPACPPEVHNNREFHTLWNSEIGCHYDHHHGDDPRELDDVLGDDVFEKMGGEISYPWQTFSTVGYENDLKHAGYFWHARKDIPCTGSGPCITAFRTLVHQHPTGRDATVRYHSYVFEAKTSDDGYLMLGGWVDFGDLHSPEGNVILNVIGNHDSRAGNGAGRHKQHSPNSGSIIWYGASQVRVDENYPRGFVTLSSTIQDSWDVTDPSDPAKFDDYVCHNRVAAGRCRSNATTLRPHLIAINMIRDFNAVIDTNGDGRSDYSGYADRYGRPVASGTVCSSYSVDCAPMILRNLKTGQNYPTANSHTANSFREYDIYFGNQSSGWNQPIP